MSRSTGDFIQPEAPRVRSPPVVRQSCHQVQLHLWQVGMRARYLIIKFLSQRSHKGHVGRSMNTIQSILGPRNSFHVSILAFIGLSETKITVKNVDAHPVLIFYYLHCAWLLTIRHINRVCTVSWQDGHTCWTFPCTNSIKTNSPALAWLNVRLYSCRGLWKALTLQSNSCMAPLCYFGTLCGVWCKCISEGIQGQLTKVLPTH